MYIKLQVSGPVELEVSDPFAGIITVTEPNGKVTKITGTGMLDNSATPAPAAALALPADVEAMVARHEKHGFKGSRSRELVRSLMERGWSVKPPGPKYLRFTHAGPAGKVTLYANSRDILTRQHRSYADTLATAIPEKNETRWRYYGANFDTALAAADSLMAYVNNGAGAGAA